MQHRFRLQADSDLGPPACFPACLDLLAIDLLPARSDADGSGVVDGFDLVRLSRAFGASQGAGYDPAVDLDGNKETDGLDLTILADSRPYAVRAVFRHLIGDLHLRVGWPIRFPVSFRIHFP